MHTIDRYRALNLHGCNHHLWSLSLLLASFHSTLHLRSKQHMTSDLLRRRLKLTLRNCRNRSPLPANPEPLSPAAGWGYNFQNLPSTHVEEPPTAPVIPSALSSKSRKALSDVSGVSGSTRYTTPSQTVAHTPGTGNRNKRAPSVTSSDEEVSSSLSSDGSMSTPPAPARRGLTPIYGPVPLPAAVPGTGRTAPVSLPHQTPGTGRTNPMNLPPTQPPQQPRNPEGLPPPGVVNDQPAPTTSTRGRGMGNRGKKRR